MKPMYYINIAGVNLHNVENIHDENGREISTYDGVGIGKFNVPDSKTAHSWKFDCELWQDGNLLKSMNTWSASEIFKLFDSLLGTVEPSRFVVTSQFYPAVNFSTLVWFKRYVKDESYPGVYKASIEVEEYKPSGVKTTDIPYVARPGKLPTVPKTITISSTKSIAKATKKYTGTAASISTKPTSYTQKFLELKDKQTGMTVSNPNTVPKNATLLAGSYVVSSQTTTKSSGAGYTTLYSSGQKSAAQSWLESTGSAISKAFTDWYNSWPDAANKKIDSLK